MPHVDYTVVLDYRQSIMLSSSRYLLGLAMVLLVQLIDRDSTPAPCLYTFKEILTFAKARPAQMIFISTSINNIMTSEGAGDSHST